MTGVANTLAIMLPGAYDTPADLLAHGFDTIAARAGLDWQAYPTDLNGVVSGALIHELHRCAVQPARRAGYRRIFLGGISIGGLTALTYQDSYPDVVDGLLLIAPYPGNRAIHGEVERGGGLAQWQPGPLAENEGELRGWRALQRLARQTPPMVWLGYGLQDRFETGLHLMARGLPASRVFTVAGGHDWPTWRTLWETLLRSEALHVA